jgi:flagellar motor component MotA
MEAHQALLERAKIFLGDRKWSDADQYCEKVLDQDPHNAMAYLYKLMAALQVRGLRGLDELPFAYNNHEYYKKALQFADANLRTALEDHRKDVTYRKALAMMTKNNNPETLNAAAALFASISDYKDAEKQKAECQMLRQKWEAKIRECKRQKTILQEERKEVEKSAVFGRTSILVFLSAGVLLWVLGIVMGVILQGAGVVCFVLGILCIALGIWYSATVPKKKWDRLDEIDQQLSELDRVINNK